MRSLTIYRLFLLFCAVVAVEGRDDCDDESITNVERNWLRYDWVLSYRRAYCTDGDDYQGGVLYNSKLYDSLRCDRDSWTGWRGREKIDIIPTSRPLEMTCATYCRALEDNDKVVARRDFVYVKVRCSDKSLGLFHARGLMHPTLTHCTMKYGWKSGNEDTFTNDIRTDQHFECRKIEPCSFYFKEGIHFNATTKTLTCSGGENSLGAIEFGSKRHPSLTCDTSNGWKDGDAKIAEADGTLDVKCVKYCASNGTGITKDSDSGARVTCPGDQLYHNDQHIPGGASCGLDLGWINAATSVAIRADTANPLNLECRPASNPVPTEAKGNETVSSVVGGISFLVNNILAIFVVYIIKV